MDRLVVDHSADAPTPNSSYLEALLERLLAEAELPTTLREFSFSIRGTPARVDVYIPDWQMVIEIPDWQMVIEADGRAWHGRLRDQEADRRRDAGLAARGIQAIRLTYRMITDDPGECLSMILAAGRIGVHHGSDSETLCSRAIPRCSRARSECTAWRPATRRAREQGGRRVSNRLGRDGWR
jgi:very-short-patch-repair endonuclease